MALEAYPMFVASQPVFYKEKPSVLVLISKFLKSYVCLLLVTVMALVGCGLQQKSPQKLSVVKKPLTTQAARNFSPLKVNHVFIYPFEGRSVEQNPVKSSELFTNAFAEQLELGTSLELLKKKVDKDGVSHNFNNAVGGKPLIERAAELGRKLGAQGVFCGVVNTFSQSDGAKYGANQPAAVSFRVWLVDPVSAGVLWTAAYQRTEHPLSENLLEISRALKQGIKYRSAPDLLREGFLDVAKALEALRVPSKAN